MAIVALVLPRESVALQTWKPVSVQGRGTKKTRGQSGWFKTAKPNPATIIRRGLEGVSARLRDMQEALPQISEIDILRTASQIGRGGKTRFDRRQRSEIRQR